MEPRLYVLVRGDLSKSQQAVQTGHAVAAYLLQHGPASWANNYLVYLKVKDLEMLEDYLKQYPEASVFREPDLKHELTAIAVQLDRDVFRDLPLV